MEILELTLHTNQLLQQKIFYEEILGLPIYEENDGEISFNCGKTLLRFLRKETSAPYHFAFNIPFNKVEEALKWLKQRVKIQKDGSAEVVDFPAWNAESIYFYDPDKNILEFIARKDLPNRASGEFTSEDILEISEIGLATENFTQKLEFLTSEVKVPKYGGGKEVFCALGSETGLFILVDKTRKNWFPTDDKAYAAAFNIKIDLHGKTTTLQYEDEILSIKQ